MFELIRNNVNAIRNAIREGALKFFTPGSIFAIIQ
jgi:hypothetical protein